MFAASRMFSPFAARRPLPACGLSRWLSSDVLPSILSQQPGPLLGEAAAEKPVAGFAVINGLRYSPRKMADILKEIRGRSVPAALARMEFSLQRRAVDVKKVILSAAANTSLPQEQLRIKEAFVTKGPFMKRLSLHGRGRAGTKTKPSCHVTVKVESAGSA